MTDIEELGAIILFLCCVSVLVVKERWLWAMAVSVAGIALMYDSYGGGIMAVTLVLLIIAQRITLIAISITAALGFSVSALYSIFHLYIVQSIVFLFLAILCGVGATEARKRF
jgi:hypothetical protein